MEATSGGERAGLVTRAVAFALDAAIVSLSLAVATWLLEATARAARQFAPPVDMVAALLAMTPLFLIAYNVAFWRVSGQTPGKWIMGVRVVPVGGGRLGVGRCLLRVFGYLISALPLYLGFAWILGPKRRAWHDRLAGTEVVYVQRHLAATSQPVTP
jgi:uncharacterized RDD family membrane protein YckC